MWGRYIRRIAIWKVVANGQSDDLFGPSLPAGNNSHHVGERGRTTSNDMFSKGFERHIYPFWCSVRAIKDAELGKAVRVPTWEYVT